jgi:hypothetical protein
MPKIEIDYSNTIIYKITCKDPSITDVYVGHTTNFVQRKHGHKQSCNNDKSSNHNCKLYKVIRDNGGWNNWTMEIVNFFNCHDHYEARKKEQEYFTLLNATLNSIEPMPKPKEKKVLIKYNPKPNITYDVCNKIFGNEKIYDDQSQPTHKYFCKICDIKTNNKKDFNKHILTLKHKNKTNITLCEQNNPKNPILQKSTCNICNKEYNSRVGLWYHKKKCKIENQQVEVKDQIDMNSLDIKLIMQILKQNDEFKALMIEQNDKLIEAYKNNKTNINNTVN